MFLISFSKVLFSALGTKQKQTTNRYIGSDKRLVRQGPEEYYKSGVARAIRRRHSYR